VPDRLLPSLPALRLRPRGELLLSLAAIGLAVALPAALLLWTTLRGWDRDRRDGPRARQALHRLRVEQAVRTVERDLGVLAERAGRRLPPVDPSESGVAFATLLAAAAAGRIPEELPDGLLVLDADGLPAYPAPATGGLEPPEVDARGEALIGDFHQRLITQPMSDAYLDLAARWVEQRLEASRSPSGRLYLPGIRWAALQRMSRDDPRFLPTVEVLGRQVAGHGAPLLPASQRLHLARELRRIGHPVALPTEPAEALGVAVSQSLVGMPALARPDLRTTRHLFRFDASEPRGQVWSLPAPGGGAAWLHRRDRLHAALEQRIDRELGSLGYAARLVPAGGVAGGPDAGAAGVSASLGASLPGWALSLDPSVAEARWAGSARREAVLQVGSAASAALLGAVLAFLAIQRFLRRVRLAEVRHDFLTTISHELRTPMTSIRMLVDSLVADPAPEPGRTRAYLEVVSGETVRLGRLVDDYLTFARLERGAMAYDFQPTAPETVVEVAVRSVRPRFAAPGCDLRTEVAGGLPRVLADAPSLTTALLNLLENAHKYTGPHKRIVLAVDRCGERVRFSVTDNGIGFDPAQRDHIFGKFHRLDGPGGTAGTVTGAGLGLHIVRSIVEAHGGEVEVESTPGRGSRFALVVPAVPDEPPGPLGPSGARPTPKNRPSR